MRKARAAKFLLGTLALGALYWFGLRTDPRVDALNRALRESGSPALLNYPYAFQVLSLDEGRAVMGTPRSAEVPVFRMIGAIYPDLAGRAPGDPDFVAAQAELARMQSEARQIVLNQQGVNSVQWSLDRNWLIEHNIQTN